MIRKSLLGASIVAGALLLSTPALAAKPAPAAAAKPALKGCRNEHGQFKKCAPAPAKPVRCRSIKTGLYAKCGTPGTKPA